MTTDNYVNRVLLSRLASNYGEDTADMPVIDASHLENKL